MDKQKLKEFSTTKLALQDMLRDFFKWKGKDHYQKHENYERKNLTGKGKHTVKVVDQPLIKLVGSLKDKSSKITYIHNKQLRDTQNKKMQNMMSKTLNVGGG